MADKIVVVVEYGMSKHPGQVFCSVNREKQRQEAKI
jgi:hypothetical protein